MVNWLRSNKYAAILLTLVRLYVGWEWLTAGWEKLTGDKAFDASGFMKGAIAKPVLVAHTTDVQQYAGFTSFLKNFALPNVKLFNFLVPWGEFLVGLGLILGCLTTAAVFFAMMMNLMYMLAGTISSNPWLFFLSVFVIVAGANAGKFGVDYYILPYVRKWMNGTKEKMFNKQSATLGH